MVNWGSVMNRSCMINWGCVMNRSWVINWSRFVNWGWMVNWFVDWCWMIDWGRLVYWSGVVRCSVLSWSWMVWGGVSFIRYVSNISSVMISSVFYILTSTIGKKNTVMSVDNCAIRSFSCVKIGSSVFVLHTIGILIWAWMLFVLRSCMIGWLRSMVGWWTSWGSRNTSDEE